MKIFILLFFILSCNDEKNIKDIYLNKTQKIQVQGDWTSEYKISYLWLRPSGPEGHRSKWIINDDIMLFTPDKIGAYSIAVSIEDNMGQVLGKEAFQYNVINKKNSLQPKESNTKSNTIKKISKPKKNDMVMTGYSLQISSWSNLNDAEKDKEKINSLGFESYINQKTINQQLLYRVRIGKQLSYSKCVKIKNELAKQNINNVWIDKNK